VRDAFDFAAPTVTVLSPKSASASGSPVFYEAYATSPACASGISAYTVNGAHIETFVTLAAGSYSTVVQAWDNCGGVAKTPVNITVKNTAGVSVFLPTSGVANTPAHLAASAQNPECFVGKTLTLDPWGSRFCGDFLQTPHQSRLFKEGDTAVTTRFPEVKADHELHPALQLGTFFMRFPQLRFRGCKLYAAGPTK